jgi:hypothetical protein
MCLLCELRDSDDPRERAMAQTLTDPNFAMMMALAVNYFMQKYGVDEVTIDRDEFDVMNIPAIIAVRKDETIILRRVSADMVTDLAEMQLGESAPRVLN